MKPLTDEMRERLGALAFEASNVLANSNRKLSLALLQAATLLDEVPWQERSMPLCFLEGVAP